MSEKQGIRISKVVKEFNIGIGTLTDFLKKKGIEVDSSPNSKIPEEAYALVEKEFDKELQIKEQSRKIILKVKRCIAGRTACLTCTQSQGRNRIRPCTLSRCKTGTYGQTRIRCKEGHYR